MSQGVVDSCRKGVEATGSSLFVIDRAVNAVALACAFDTQGGGLLCMRDDNAHHGLDSCAATPVGPRAEGTRV